MLNYKKFKKLKIVTVLEVEEVRIKNLKKKFSKLRSHEIPVIKVQLKGFNLKEVN